MADSTSSSALCLLASSQSLLLARPLCFFLLLQLLLLLLLLAVIDWVNSLLGASGLVCVAPVAVLQTQLRKQEHGNLI
jgi:hypothetical protein